MTGIVEYRLKYQYAPIVLVGGLASDLPGANMSILSLLQAQDFGRGITQPPTIDSAPIAEFFAIPGGTAIDNQIGMYPFANQTVAANAIIAQPLSLSLLMIMPNRDMGNKRAVFENMQSQIAKHCSLGGVFNVATPSLLYTNCILTRVQDATQAGPTQTQTEWRWDFLQPLLTIEAAQAAQNLLMRKLGPNGTPVDGDPPSGSTLQIGVGSGATVQGPSVSPPLAPSAASAGLRGPVS